MNPNEMRRSSDSSKDQSEEERGIDIEMPRLPDVVLREIFSHLDFSDIKSCRLVSKQWHRHALDNVNFILAIQRLPIVRESWIKRVWNCLRCCGRPASSAADDNDDDINRHRNRMALIPYSASAKLRLRNDDAFQEWAHRIIKTMPPPTATATINFTQMPSIVNDNIARKIKNVVVKDVRSILQPVLQMLEQLMPTVKQVRAFDNDSLTAIFDRQPQSGDLRCHALVLPRRDNVEDQPFYSFGMRLLSNDYSGLELLLFPDWWCLRQALENLQDRNHDQTLTFDACTHLFVHRNSPQPIIAPFRSIAVHFPKLQKLLCTIGPNNPADDIQSLEQLGSLVLLSIAAADFQQVMTLPKLCLPNLVELHLGDNILVPENPRHFDSTGLQKLSLDADPQNMLRLKEYIEHGGGRRLKNLATVTMRNAPAEDVVPSLEVILRHATQLQDAVSIGTFYIPNEAFDCRGLVQQLVDVVKQRSLQTTITVVFVDNDDFAMTSALLDSDVGGVGVTVSAMAGDAEDSTCDLTWHNAAGIQQKLKIQVK